MIVEMQIAKKHGGSLLRARIDQSVRPLAAKRLNEPLDFAVSARCIRLGAQVSQLERRAGRSEHPRDKTTAVVGHDSFSYHSHILKPLHRSPQKCNRCGFALVMKNFGVRNPRGVVDAHIGELPSSSQMRSSPIAGDPVTDSFDTSKLLDTDVQQ